jgi:tRNA pseudouridine38-40 synthase
MGVQQKLEEALQHIFPGAGRAYGSSRTDTGVHAVGMVVHVDVPAVGLRMPVRKIPLALNAWLPEDVRVVEARRAPGSFHARFDAAGKQYRYFVWNHPVMNPLLRNRAWHVTVPLELRSMRAGASLLLGRRDFRSFAAHHSYEVVDTVRTLKRLEVRKQGPLVTFTIEADGFLYKMCRGLVGTLVQVGQGKFDAGSLPSMLEARDRRVAGATAPAQGLVLWKVFYKRGGGRPGSSSPERDDVADS